VPVLDHASFAELWQPPVFLAFAAVLVIYLLVVGPLRGRIPGSAPVPSGKKWAFALALLTLYLAAGSPLDILADDTLVSAHMVEHMLFTMVAAPLLLLGTPDWFWRPLLTSPRTRRAFTLFTNPVFGIVFFNGAFTMLHFPYFVDWAVRSDAVHFCEHVLMIVSALSMWWAVLSPLPERPALSEPLQIVYFFIDSIAMNLVFAYMTFYPTQLYTAYGERARLFGLTPVGDQQLGGVIMKVTSEVIYGAGVLVNFLRWARRAREEEGRRPAEVLLLRVQRGLGIRSVSTTRGARRGGEGGHEPGRP
jgi:putative membrane protein